MGVRWRGGHATVVIRGDVDLDSAGEITRAVRTLVDAHARSVEVDAGGVDFIDLTGLRCLQRAGVAVTAAGGEFRLGPVSPPVARVMQLSGLVGPVQELGP